jgi:hypothetical protein
MFGRSKWLIMIPAIILIPILLGMTPLNLLHKLGSGCAFSHEKQAQKCSPSSLNSQNSQDGHLIVVQPLVTFNHEVTPSYYPILNSDSTPFFGASEFAPLRC